MRNIVHVCLGLWLAAFALHIHAAPTGVVSANCLEFNQGKCVQWKAMVDGYHSSQRRYSFEHWDSAKWDRAIVYCDPSNRIDYEFLEVCKQIKGIERDCLSSNLGTEYKNFCDNANLSPPKIMVFINAVYENLDGVMSCGTIIDVFRKGFPLPEGKVNWPKQPDRNKASPLNLKQMAINMDEINSIQIITTQNMVNKVAEFASKKMEKSSEIKKRVDAAEGFLNAIKDVKFSRLIPILAIGAQPAYAECDRTNIDIDKKIKCWGDIADKGDSFASDRRTIVRLSAYINNTDVIKCLSATENIKAALKQ
jgi:hypothetical protein